MISLAFIYPDICITLLFAFNTVALAVVWAKDVCMRIVNRDRETRDIDGNSIQCKVALCNCFVATRWALHFYTICSNKMGTCDTNVGTLPNKVLKRSF